MVIRRTQEVPSGWLFVGADLQRPAPKLDKPLNPTLPQTNMEIHIAPFERDCSLYRALWVPFFFQECKPWALICISLPCVGVLVTVSGRFTPALLRNLP